MAMSGALFMGALTTSAHATPASEGNLALLHAFLEAIRKAAFTDRNPAAIRKVAEQYLSPDYIQHLDGPPPGREGYITYMTEAGKTMPPGPLPFEDVYFMADDNRVVWMSKGPKPDPMKPGQMTVGFGFNMMRIENGKFAEHWAG